MRVYLFVSLSLCHSQIAESFIQRDAQNTEQLRIKEEEMAASRQIILENQRAKNADWEARQLEKTQSCYIR